MAKPQIRTKSAHSFTVVWHPPRYQVHWVYQSEDIPPWDSTRGGNAYSFNAFTQKTYEEYIESWNKHNERKKDFIPEKILQPPRVYLAHLVRTDWNIPPEFPTPWHSPKHTLVKALADLIPLNRHFDHEEIISSEQFKQGVICISNQHGVYATNSAGSSMNWLELAITAATHLDWLYRLKDTDDIASIQASLCDAWGIEIVPEGAKCQSWVQVAAHYTIFNYSAQTALEEGIESSRVYRTKVAQYLRNQFKNYAKDPSFMEFRPEDSAIYLRVGISVWLLWEIAKLYDEHTEIKKCSGCGRYFEARGKQKWCQANTSTCRMRVKRQQLSDAI